MTDRAHPQAPAEAKATQRAADKRAGAAAAGAAGADGARGDGAGHLDIEDVTVQYATPDGPVTAVDRLTLRASAGEVVAVLGPSGCGKSTLLRAIAGLEPIVSGQIRLGGRDLAGIRPDQRDIGLAFQDHVLFPHRSVAENVGFGPRVRGWDRARATARVADVLDLVDLGGFEDRMPAELSGGEQQRVALARTIAARPSLLMLDEPLGALDRALRDRLLGDLPTVFADLDATVLYVTHDHDEALTLADRVAIMSAGHLLQVATPEQLWREPADVEVARFLGLDQLVDAEVQDGVATTPLGAFASGGHRDGPVTVLVLPDAVRFVTEPGPASHEAGAPSREPDADDLVVEGTVAARRFSGDRVITEVVVQGRGQDLTFAVTSRPTRAPRRGDRCRLAIDRSLVRILPRDTA